MSPVFDHPGSLKRMGGDQQLFQEMIGFLLEDAPRLLDKLRASVAEGRYGEAQHAAHTLKGLISNFGASRATAAAAQAEEFAGQGEASVLPRVLVELEAALNELLRALTPHAAKHAHHA